MNEAQLDYISVFYDLFEAGKEALGWTEKECSDAIVERAESMRRRAASLPDRFTENEWIEIFNYVIDFELS